MVRTLKTFLKAFSQMYHDGELDTQEARHLDPGFMPRESDVGDLLPRHREEREGEVLRGQTAGH